MKILIVDDDKKDLDRICYLVSNMFQSAEVFFTEDEKQALDIVKKEYPDIVILDVVLKKEHGYSLCSKIVKIHSDAVVIIVTSNLHAVDNQLALESGAYDFTIKSKNMQELRVVLEKVQKRIEALRT